MYTIGICGREGSGKTTTAEYLVPPPARENELPAKVLITDRLEFIVETLFGKFPRGADVASTEPIWGMSYNTAYGRVLKLLKEKIHPEIGMMLCKPIAIPYEAAVGKPPIAANGWAEYSFADPLKRIAAVIFEIDYFVLLGNTEENRKLRETVCCPFLVNSERLTGRRCLEYLGTEVFRNGFDSLIWVRLAQRYIKECQALGTVKGVVIPDVRFENEYIALTEVGAQIWAIYRKPEDLICTSADIATHPAKWHFLRFVNQSNVKKIHNAGNKEELYAKIKQLL